MLFMHTNRDFLGISPRGGKTDICIFMGGQECFEKIFTH